MKLLSPVKEGTAPPAPPGGGTEMTFGPATFGVGAGMTKTCPKQTSPELSSSGPLLP